MADGSLLEQLESSQLQFTVLYGSQSYSGAHSYLLEISGVRILLDCGWDVSYDVSMLEPLERVADQIKLVLISHANIEHIGALPYVYKHFKLTAECWCTFPVLKLGHLVMYDAVLNGTAPFNLDDVDLAVSHCKEGVYMQDMRIRINERSEILIQPQPSGRTLGGAFWSIMQEDLGLSVMFCSDIYQRREKLLDGLDPSTLPRDPTLLIQDTIGLGNAFPPLPAAQPQLRITTEQARDVDIVNAVVTCLRKGGDVLIPAESSSRALEILLLLDEEWLKSNLGANFELIFLTRVSSMLDVTATHVEWTSKRIQDQMDNTKQTSEGPLSFRSVAVVDSFEEAFPSLRNRVPRVVVCGGPDMERSSFSREVFAREMAHRPNCLVLLLAQSFVESSLASQLAKGFKVVTMDEERWVDLEGAELEEWQRKQEEISKERQREREAEEELLDYERAGHDESEGLTSTLALQRQSSQAGLERSLSQVSAVTTDYLPRDPVHDDHICFTFVPPEHRDTVWDEYGATFDEHELLGEEEQQRAKDSAMDEVKENSKIDLNYREEPKSQRVEEDIDIAPRKKESVQVQTQVHCEVKLVDLNGRLSRKDLFEIVHLIKPKKLVVVRSGLRDAEKFALECQSKASCGVSYSPAPGECLDIAADSSVVRVRVPDETLQSCPPAIGVSNLHVQKLRGRMALLSLASQTGNVTQKRRRVVHAGGEIPSILSLREGEDEALGDAECWWVSKKDEPSLASVELKLRAARINSKLDKGVLLCGVAQDVTVWKPGDGRMLVSGPLSDLYYSVRKIVYDSYALV